MTVVIVNLYPQLAGIVPEAQPRDASDQPLGLPIASGFVSKGSGVFQWQVPLLPANTQSVDVQDHATHAFTGTSLSLEDLGLAPWQAETSPTPPTAVVAVSATLPLGSPRGAEAFVRDPVTLQPTNADEPPVVTVFRNGTQQPALAVTIVQAGFGEYSYGYETVSFGAGDVIDELVTATIGGVAYSTSLTYSMRPPASAPESAGVLVTLSFRSDPPTDSVPVTGASAWVTSDQAGQRVVEGPILTDTTGGARFLLLPGVTYYAWMRRDGVNPVLGKAFVAAED